MFGVGGGLACDVMILLHCSILVPLLYQTCLWAKHGTTVKTAAGMYQDQELVSEPDPQNIGKEGLVNGAGWKCTLWDVRNFTTC